ncbi:hypothetical protein [Enhygromyxa salina]|uniref:Endo-1,4-beta-xylanase A n=1 Tax=Enhygromyxa salina TaxID=215803 RepID=A0A2S9YS01_9BACT|nr:hypothetical protein [Enhygromyxa salina]PRQ07866.1 hypothetical protein ENSA7_24310 [Enhygromyxa salina]
MGEHEECVYFAARPPGAGTVAETSDSNNSAEGNSASADQNGDGDGDGDTDPGDGDADTTPGDGDGDSGEDGNKPKWDTLAVPDGSEQCGGGNDDFEFSFLWAANSSQGTISKIDTKTVTEVGRYIVRPDNNGSPSRTSVALSGHVAVAKRSGGVTKIYADQQFRQESNGMPGIQTSNNNQFLPWARKSASPGTCRCSRRHDWLRAQQRRHAFGVMGCRAATICSATAKTPRTS